jgi:hypothetical protein
LIDAPDLRDFLSACLKVKGTGFFKTSSRMSINQSYSELMASKQEGSQGIKCMIFSQGFNTKLDIFQDGVWGRENGEQQAGNLMGFKVRHHKL